MKARCIRSVGVVALTYSMALLMAGRFRGSSAYCTPLYIGDGDCDDQNNNIDCGYDGGDCCEETCVEGEYTCGRNGGFDCQDPDYMDKDDDDTQQSGSSSFGFSCQEERIGNGYCNPGNNNEICAYDGGDCCSCTCPNVPWIKCGGQAGNTCIDPTAPCLDGYVEAATLTTVTVKASRFDQTRKDDETAECAPGGCVPEYTRDGEFDDESLRWQCSDSEYPCVLTFYFEEPLNIEYLQVAFLMPDYFTRGVQVHSNGVELGFFPSSSESTFTAYGMHADAVETLTLTSSSGAFEFEGFSLLEVRFMVEVPGM